MSSGPKPKLGELVQRLKELTWAESKLMLIQLEVEFPTLKNIEAGNKEISDCKLAALNGWLTSDPAASWSKVVEGLRSIDKNVLAGKIEAEFCTASQPISPTRTDDVFSSPGDVILNPRDAIDITEELLPAQTQAHFLGLKLKLPNHVVESISTQYLCPKDRLFHVIEEFLKQVDPLPTWRVIVEAVKSPAIGLPRLAQELEQRHCTLPTTNPTPTSPRS